MLRGIGGVVGPHKLEPGRFYMSWNSRQEPELLQCVRTDRKHEGEPLDLALVFTPSDGQRAWLEPLPDFGAIVQLPEVHVRLDPTEAVGNERRTSIRPGMIVVGREQVVIIVPTDQARGFQAVDVLTGRYVTGSLPPQWVAFSSVSFVIDEGEKERELARFIGTAPER